MIGINFGKWTSSHGEWFSGYRIYHNWKWTPFVWYIPRYCEATSLPKKLEAPHD